MLVPSARIQEIYCKPSTPIVDDWILSKVASKMKHKDDNIAGGLRSGEAALENSTKWLRERALEKLEEEIISLDTWPLMSSSAILKQVQNGRSRVAVL